MAAMSHTSGSKAESGQQISGGEMASTKGKQPARLDSNSQQAQAAAAGEAMEETLPILPTGFVANTAEVYHEVASFDAVPPEKMREYWRVYTITHKKLYDPTANRLENFWWHVWGSKRRDLSGKTVAKLYQEISSGPTFVPLKTPTSRYDGPTIPDFSGAPRPAHSPESATVEEVSPKTKDDEQHKAQTIAPTSLASEPQPAQSILRKPKPPQSGPHPTPPYDLPEVVVAAKQTDTTANETSAIEEESDSIASAIADATAGSVDSQSGRTSKTTTDRQKPSMPKTSLPVSSTKTVAAKQESKKPAKAKPAKKKFVVTASGGSKKRPLIARRAVTLPALGPEPGDRLPGPSKPSRQSPTTQIVEEDELEDKVDDDLLPIDNISAPVSPANDRSHARPHQAYQQSSVQSHPYRNSPLSEKAAGKQPIRPLYSPQMERTLSQASESTAASSISGSTVASATVGTIAAAVLSSSPSTMLGSTSAPPASTENSGPARRESSTSQASAGVVSAAGSSILDMPTATRNFPVAQRPSPLSGTLVRPGGLIRQNTMPYERGAVPRQQIIRAGSTTSLAPLRSPLRTTAPSSAFMSQVSAAAPAMTTSPSTFSAPLMGRSISQDSYGSGVRAPLSYPSPKLGPMRSSTIAAPSIIAASGQFMDPEGPDTFSFYSKTGLDDNGEVEEEDDGELSSSFSGDRSNSFGSSYQEAQATQRAPFTPTRPSQTPRIPFARTRSQLNVILDREKERLGKGNYNSWNEARGGRDHDSQRRGS